MSQSLITSNLEIGADTSCVAAVEIYETGKKTCERLYDISQDLTGESKDDILRAMLLFACSTIDSIGKRLAHDCLTDLINKTGPDGQPSGAHNQFESFVKSKIKKDAAAVLSKVLVSQDYRLELITLLKDDIDGSSLQSFGQIDMLVSRLGIKASTEEIISRKDAEVIFDIRNKITHEMDIVATTGVAGSSTQKAQRAEAEFKELTEKMLASCKTLIEKVYETLKA